MRRYDSARKHGHGLMHAATRLVLASLAFGASACAHAAPRAVAEPGLRVHEVASDREVPVDAWLDSLAPAPVVCFGERHDHVGDHRAQVALAEALSLRRERFAIGLEMVEAPRQSVLDAWVAGELDEPTLLAQLAWEERWGFDFDLYRDLFLLARARGIPLIALNARREVVRLVARVGVQVARAELGGEVPELTIDPDYRALIETALAEHAGMRPEQLEGYLAAQRLWDETMAASVAAALARDGGPTQVLVLAGAFHCAYGLGIPSALRARGVEGTRIVLGREHQTPAIPGRSVADFVVEPRIP